MLVRRHPALALIAALFTLTAAAPAVAQSPAKAPAITTPKQFFGFNIGDDYQLATYDQFMGYWKKIDQESNRMQVIEIGNRADVYTTLESIFVKRHEHALIFKQAFELFFRPAEEWKHMLDSVPLPDHAKKKPPPASRRVLSLIHI